MGNAETKQDTSETKTTVCQKAGERKTNQECVKLGKCSWFRHSQDSMQADYPPGYDRSLDG